MKRTLQIFAVSLVAAGVAFAQPALHVETPGNGATVGTTVTLTGTATPFSRVVVSGDLAGDVKVDKNGNWMLELDAQSMSSGDPVDLNVISRDAKGQVSQPVVLSFPRTGGPAATTSGTTTDRTRLSVAVSEPRNNAKVAQQFTLTGTATPGTKVELTGDAVGNTTADASGNWTLNVNTKAPLNSDLVLRVRAKNLYNVESNEVVLNYEVTRASTATTNPPTPGTTPTPGFGTNPR